MERFGDLFAGRQLVALDTFANLVGEATQRVRLDAEAAGLPTDRRPLRDGGTGAQAYSEAIAVYLACAVSRATDYWGTGTIWEAGGSFVAHVFTRNALPMTWDYPEANPFSQGSGSWQQTCVAWIQRYLRTVEPSTVGMAHQADARVQEDSNFRLVSTDPPYYDNIPYADLSDFFYVWLRRSLRMVFPELFATLAVPKSEELVAFSYRHGSKEAADDFFLDGMTLAMRRLSERAHPAYPVTIYYPFKQSETKAETGTVSTGWATFLDAVIRAGFAVNGTWPIRTERPGRMRETGSNALASSIVLVCRRRPAAAPTIARRAFLAALRAELSPALSDLQKSNIAPVDFAQAAIGPGMAVFTRYSQVLEADGSPMAVRSALIEINRMLDETLARTESDLDLDTRFCVAWYDQYGLGERPYGEAEVLLNAKNTTFEGLQRAGVVVGGKGKIRITRREELDPGWNPATDRRATDWEGAQHLTRALTAERGGGVAEAARLVVAMGAERAEKARALAYRLHAVADRRRWADEARAYNVLVTSWPQIQAEAARLNSGAAEQVDLELSPTE